MIECVGPSGLEILVIIKSGASRHRQRMCRAFGPQQEYRNVKTHKRGSIRQVPHSGFGLCSVVFMLQLALLLVVLEKPQHLLATLWRKRVTEFFEKLSVDIGQVYALTFSAERSKPSGK